MLPTTSIGFLGLILGEESMVTRIKARLGFGSKFQVEDGETRRGHDSLWGSDRILIGVNRVVRL